MNTEFPQEQKKFLRSEDFQDQKRTLTFRGWEKVANEDRPANGRFPGSTWQQSLKYCLRYTYPEFAMDAMTGTQRLGADGKPWKNRYYDENYPHGYLIKYVFDEGVLESGSLPLWKAFCLVSPAPGDRVVIGKTGKDKETVWEVKRSASGSSVAATSDADVPAINFDDPDFSGDPSINPDTRLPF